MRKKKIIGIILAAVLVAAGLGSFAHANPDPVNKVSAMFSTQWYYDVPGDSFMNGEVEGHEDFFAQMENDPDGTEADVTGLTLTLDSGLAFDCIEPDPVTIGPPTYEWSFGDVPEGLGPVAWVGFMGPTQPLVPLTPGFSASRSLSETEFSAPDTQTLTITLTPQEDEVMTEGGWFSIGVGVHENDLVDAVITSPTGGEGIQLRSEGHRLDIHPTGLSVGIPWSITVTIEVTPKVPKVEFMPFVDIKWFGPPSASGSTSFYAAPGAGTWTWSATGSYEWQWTYNMMRGLQWHPCSREILVNTAEVQYSTFRVYTAPGNTFENGEVTGDTWWHTELWNTPDASEEPIAGPELSLDTGLALDWYPLASAPTLVTEGPPTYEWGLADLSEGEAGTVFVHPTNPADEVLGSFTPGFNASVSVDRIQFSQLEGTQTQTLTITVEKVDPEARITLLVFTDESLFPLLPVDKGDLVEAVIPSSYEFPEWTEFVFPGGTGFIMDTMHMEPDETRVIEIPIEVTPKVPRVEYKPAVNVGSKGAYPERQSHFGTFHSFEVDSLGTWTWSAEGEYDWRWQHREEGGQVVFPGISSAIEDFAIEHMFIDFDQRPNHDKIDIKKATFRLPEGATYDLAVDDVTVTVDGVVITIPAGSFVQGKGGDYIFKTPKGVEPKVDMKLNFDKGEWHFKVDKIDASAVDNCDGVDVAFCIGYMAARENIDMQIGGLSYIAEE